MNVASCMVDTLLEELVLHLKSQPNSYFVKIYSDDILKAWQTNMAYKLFLMSIRQ